MTIWSFITNEDLIKNGYKTPEQKELDYASKQADLEAISN